MIVKRDDFGAALNEVEPSAMREVLVELPRRYRGTTSVGSVRPNSRFKNP